jgi:hypothetical protein
MIHERFWLVSDAASPTKESIKEVHIDTAFAGRSRAKTFVAPSNLDEPLTLYREVVAASYDPR